MHCVEHDAGGGEGSACVRTYLEEIAKVRAADGEDELVGAQDLALGREGDVHQLLARQQGVQAGGEVAREGVPDQGELLARRRHLSCARVCLFVCACVRRAPVSLSRAESAGTRAAGGERNGVRAATARCMHALSHVCTYAIVTRARATPGRGAGSLLRRGRRGGARRQARATAARVHRVCTHRMSVAGRTRCPTPAGQRCAHTRVACRSRFIQAAAVRRDEIAKNICIARSFIVLRRWLSLFPLFPLFILSSLFGALWNRCVFFFYIVIEQLCFCFVFFFYSADLLFRWLGLPFFSFFFLSRLFARYGFIETRSRDETRVLFLLFFSSY